MIGFLCTKADSSETGVSRKSIFKVLIDQTKVHRLGIATFGMITVLAIPLSVLGLKTSDAEKSSPADSSNSSASNSSASVGSDVKIEAESHVEANVPPTETAPGTAITTSHSSSADGSKPVEVNINGQSVDVPKNGSVSTTVSADNGQTTSVNIQTQSSTNANSFSSNLTQTAGSSQSTTVITNSFNNQSTSGSQP